jgi:K+/H+ antiporter YhaU regulatory subunit KhtT
VLAFFPLSKQHAEIQRCADILEAHHGEDANRVWRTEMKALAARLQAQGAGAEEIGQQIGDFNAAVQTEIQRRWLAQIPAAN